MEIELGALARPISEQIKNAGFELSGADAFDRDADAITRLYIRGVLTEGEAHKARTRLMKELGKAWDKQQKALAAGEAG